MAFTPDGSVRIKIFGDISDFNKSMTAVTNSISKFGKTLMNLGAAVGLAFGVGALVNFGKESIKLASDIQEFQNVIDVTFGQGARQIEEFAQSAAAAFGLSELSAKQYTGTMGAMLKSSGLATAQAQEMSTTLAGLAGDMASFYNLDTDTAFEKIRSGIAGEIEPLRQLGINMSVANLEAYALSQGITKVYNAMSPAEQTLLRYNYLLSVTTDAQGDFARTSGSFANQVRLLQLNFDQLRIAVGNALIPIAQAVLPSINAIIEDLTKLAQVFAQVTALLFGKSAEVKAVSGIASSAGAAADATDKLADSTAGAGSAAKKAAKDMKGVLAGFDELNILADNAADSVGGAAGGLGGGIPDLGVFESEIGGELFADTEVNPKIEQKLRSLIDRLNELKSILLAGFDFGLGDVDFSGVEQSLKNIGTYLANIFTDEDVATAAKRFIDSFVFAVGSFAGSLVSVGISLSELVFGGIEGYLSDNTDRIRQWIIRMFDVGTEVNEILSNLFATISDLFTVLSSDSAKSIASSFIQILEDVLGGGIEIAAKLGRDILDTITAPFIENKEKLKKAFEDFMAPIAQIMESIAAVVREAVDGIVALYDEHIHPFIMSVKASFTEWFNTMLDGWNTYIKPVLDNIANKFNEVVQNHVIPMINQVLEFLGKVFDAVKLLWDNVLSPVINWMIQYMAPQVGFALDIAGTAFNTFLAVASDVISGIFEALGGVIDFISGVFTGDWEKAWNGLNSILKGIIKLITAPIEGLISLIGSVINKIKDFLGWSEKAQTASQNVGRNMGKDNSYRPNPTPSFKPSPRSFAYFQEVTDLPRLANGAVIPPNQQFAAILGDQRSGMNIESPLKTIEQALRNVMGESNFGSDVVINLTAELDGKVLTKKVIRVANAMTRAAGKPVLLN